MGSVHSPAAFKALGFSDEDIKQAEPADSMSTNYVNLARHLNDQSYNYMGEGTNDMYTTLFRVYELYIRFDDVLVSVLLQWQQSCDVQRG